MSKVGAFKNMLANSPGRERVRVGTYWCQSDDWQLNEHSLSKYFYGDKFNMDQCQGDQTLKF